MILIKLSEEKSSRRARRWCVDNFGKIPLKPISEFDRKTQMAIMIKGNFYGKHVYDSSNARWLHRMRNPYNFYFKNEEDAIAFKIMWA